MLSLAWALLALPPAMPQPCGRPEVREKEARFNTTYSDWVNADLLNIYAFNHSVRRNRVSRRDGLCPAAPPPRSSGAPGRDAGYGTRALPRGPSKVQASASVPLRRRRACGCR